jgi:hypothetical protein
MAAAAAVFFVSGSALAAPMPLGEAGFAKMDQDNGGLGKDVGFNGVTTEDFEWVPGQTIDWSYQYDGTKVIFTWGGQTVDKVVPLGGAVVGFEGYVRNTDKLNRNTQQSVLPQDLTLTVDIGPVGGTDLGPILANLGDGFVNFMITESLGNSFVVSGTAQADWTGALASSPNSRFAFQIDAIVDPDAVQVSEPATLGLLGVGFLALGLRRRSHR